MSTPWFNSSSPLATVPLLEIAQAVHRDPPLLMLPSFQRDAVWREQRIIALWDSILRGFPIGTILLARPRDLTGAHVVGRRLQNSLRSIAEHQQDVSRREGFVLIDGQQRVIAITLGLSPFTKKNSARLWLDLAPPERRAGTQRFRFHVCSALKPWGDIPVEAPLAAAASASIGITRKDGIKKILPRTWPVKAGFPVPFAELVAAVAKGKEPDWKQLHSLVQSGGKKAPIRKIQDDVVAAINGMLRYQVPLHLITSLDDIEDVQLAFDRLNKGGVQLGQDELFFSGLKLIWPQSHDLVWEIFEDIETGRVLAPIPIVHAAARIAYQQPTEKQRGTAEDIPRLTEQVFRTRIDIRKGEEQPFVKKLKKSLGNENGRGHLHRLIHTAKALLLFPGEPEEDPGLPLPMLQSLPWRVWHTLIAWLHVHKGSITKRDRLEMIRFALFDTLYISRRNPDRVLRAEFLTAWRNPARFPGKAIYKEIDPGDIKTQSLLTPHQFARQSRNGMLDEEPIWELLHGENQILLWNQRWWLHHWFGDWDPTRFLNPDSQPYDLDHIMPSNLFRMHGASGASQTFHDWRGALQNSIGNKRFWPRGLNRSDQDRPPSRKYLTEHSNTRLPEDAPHLEFDMETVGEVKDASALLNPADWRGLPEHKRQWLGTLAMTRRFRKAVERRRYLLYKQMYDTVGWEKWAE